MRAVVDTLPGAAIASTLLLQFIKLPYQKRTEKWQQDISDALEHIQRNGFDLENLKENEDFIDILLQIVPTGIKHHQEEKRTALKNALIHLSDKASLPAIIECHQGLFDGATINSVAADKGYYSADNEKYLQTKGVNEIAIQRPKNIKKQPINPLSKEREDDWLIDDQVSNP